jgi:hypothetical protein
MVVEYVDGHLVKVVDGAASVENDMHVGENRKRTAFVPSD